MRIVFRRLFRIRVRHDWYADGTTRGEFAVVPTASTAALLAELGLRARAFGDGLVVFGEVEPDTAPPVLRRPLGATSFRFAFELRAASPALLNVTELPAFRPARTIFCFDNLREDLAAGRAHLGDRVAGTRIGAPVTLVTGTYTHTLGAPAAAATLTVRDRFGGTVATIEVRSPDPGIPAAAHRIDLAAVPKIVPGRYTIADSVGGTSSIYFDPDLAASRPPGVVEIYTRTDGLTPDATDRVPPSYRFLVGDAVSGPDAYYLQFEPVATTWRYIVTKKYDNNGIALGQLSITGPVAFTPAVAGTQAVFTSTAAVRLSSTPRALKLIQHPNKDIRDLPNPDLATPLGSVPAMPNFVSDMFVYV